MGTYRQIFYQIVFSTKNRKPSISTIHQAELYHYIYGVIQHKQCRLYRINSMPDHIHIFSDLHPTISLSDLVKAIKVASNSWMKESDKFPEFDGWQDGYGAFTYSIREKEMIINYIKNQQEHHKKEIYEDEFKRLLKEHGVEFHEKYLW